MYPSIISIINNQDMPFLLKMLFFTGCVMDKPFKMIKVFHLIYMIERGIIIFLEKVIYELFCK